jgi:AcrR family transcriptional regulator
MSTPLKKRLLQAAAALFYSQGIKATGVDAIVKAADTTKMSLYKYFPSKDDLVLAYLCQSAADMKSKIFAGLAHYDSDPKTQLLAIFDVFDELLASPEFRGCPFINAAAEFAVEDNPVLKAADQFYLEFRQLLAELARNANVYQADELAQQLSMLIVGAIVSEQLNRGSGAMAVARRTAQVLIEYTA